MDFEQQLDSQLERDRVLEEIVLLNIKIHEHENFMSYHDEQMHIIQEEINKLKQRLGEL